MKKLIFFYFLFSNILTIAQTEWFPVGAKWYYNLQELEQYKADGYRVFTVMKDTIVDSKQSKCISKTSINYKGQILNSEDIIMRVDNKRVYWYNNDSFQLIYDFSLNPGDTLERNVSTIGCDSVSPIIVDSITETSINGVLIKIQHLSYVGYNTHFNGEDFTFRKTIMGKIGIEDNFMYEPFTCSIDDNFAFTGLRCYIDNNLEYHSDWWKNIYNNIACDTLIWGVNAQAFVSTNKLWSTMAGPVYGCPSSFFCSSYFTKFAGDTVLRGIHYSKVLRSEDQQMQNWIIEGFIREDTNKKVYYRDTNSIDECLLYDFGCSVGDTVFLNCTCPQYGFLVDSIKSKILDGTPRRHFYLTYMENETKGVWIEGIGSTLGVLNIGYGHCMTGGGEALLCFFEGGIKKYQDSEFPNYCYLSPEIINGIEIGKAIAQFKVYPNPVSGELFIQPSSNIEEGYTLELYSTKGEKIKSECIEPGSNLYRFDTSSLRNGIYILRLISASGKYSEEEVIVKE